MVELGVPVALATDFNPGTSPTYAMPMAVALACIGMRLLPSEAIAAATINAAHAIGMAEEVGSLEPGKAADLVILDVMDFREVTTAFGTNPVGAVVKRGRVVWRAASMEGAT
jgi:imidazolonepropionase